MSLWFEEVRKSETWLYLSDVKLQFFIKHWFRRGKNLFQTIRLRRKLGLLRDVSPSQGLLQFAKIADWRSSSWGETSLNNPNFPSLSDCHKPLVFVVDHDFTLQPRSFSGLISATNQGRRRIYGLPGPKNGLCLCLIGIRWVSVEGKRKKEDQAATVVKVSWFWKFGGTTMTGLPKPKSTGPGKLNMPLLTRVKSSPVPAILLDMGTLRTQTYFDLTRTAVNFTIPRDVYIRRGIAVDLAQKKIDSGRFTAGTPNKNLLSSADPFESGFQRLLLCVCSPSWTAVHEVSFSFAIHRSC